MQIVCKIKKKKESVNVLVLSVPGKVIEGSCRVGGGEEMDPQLGKNYILGIDASYGLSNNPFSFSLTFPRLSELLRKQIAFLFSSYMATCPLNTWWSCFWYVNSVVYFQVSKVLLA